MRLCAYYDHDTPGCVADEQISIAQIDNILHPCRYRAYRFLLCLAQIRMERYVLLLQALPRSRRGYKRLCWSLPELSTVPLHPRSDDCEFTSIAPDRLINMGSPDGRSGCQYRPCGLCRAGVQGGCSGAESQRSSSQGQEGAIARHMGILQSMHIHAFRSKRIKGTSLGR